MHLIEVHASGEQIVRAIETLVDLGYTWGDHNWSPPQAVEAVSEPDLLPGLRRAVAIAQTVPGYETSPVYDAIFGEAVRAGETL